MNYLPIDAVLAPGEPVYTSATSATFPPDVLIGTVTRVFERDPFLTFQSAEVTLAIRPWNLKEVLVLRALRPEPAAPPRAGAPLGTRALGP
jgi:cell shape-determining protein MreC